MPAVVRFSAVILCAVIVIIVAIGFYRNAGNAEFRMKGLPASLSKDVIATVDGYERREVEGDAVKYYIKADKATTFADEHQEMENVYLQVFDQQTGGFDEMTARKAIYVPEENKGFKAYFAGDVVIKTRDDLELKTDNLTYDRATETANGEEKIEFSRGNIRGSAIGARVESLNKKVELLREVEIETLAGPEGNTGERLSNIKAGYAMYDQSTEKIELRDGVHIISTSSKAASSVRTADIRSGLANVSLAADANEDRNISDIEFFGDVQVVTVGTDQQQTKITAGYLRYDKPAERFDLRQNVLIVTSSADEPTTIRSGSAIFEQQAGKVVLNDSAEILQKSNYVKGQSIVADLYADNRLKYAVVMGNAYSRQLTPERTTEVTGPELNVSFDDNENMTLANVVGQGRIVVTASNDSEYTKFALAAPNAIRVKFRPQGLLDSMQTDGRTTIDLSVPSTSPDAANKKLIADVVKTTFGNDGRSLAKAEAVGNAELFVEPLKPGPENYKTTVRAKRFDCDFYPGANNVRDCAATGGTNTVRVPTIAREGRGNQTITSNRLDAKFGAASNGIEEFDASGNAKFVELDRNAVADRFAFTSGDEIVRLRGGEPTVWDSQARGKAKEIDWDTKNSKSVLRGAVSTTYFSQKQTNGAAPFGGTEKPVFLTSETAEIDHGAQTALYTGNARAWQDDNYVRGNTLLIRQKEGQFIADGSVQSLLYDVGPTGNSKAAKVPVYASSRKMTYNRSDRSIRYETDVDIRQGSDRIRGAVANVYLDENNELVRSDVERDVVITQPGRKAVGDFAQYVAATETVVMRGNPARIDDVKNGSSQGSQVTVFLRDNRVIGDGRTQQNPTGRVRSVYKVTNE